MRKDMLLKDWCKMVRFADDYKIQVGFMLSCGDDNWVLECFADLYIDGEVEEMQTIDFIESADKIEKIPASMKRKAKSFYEYFKACSTFQDAISLKDELISV